MFTYLAHFYALIEEWGAHCLWGGACSRCLRDAAAVCYKSLSPWTCHVMGVCSGKICLDILKDAWGPTQNASNVLLAIVSLLADPNADSPVNAEIAEVLKSDRYLVL